MSLAGGDLTTVADVQAYWGLTNAPASSVLKGLITRVSRMLLTNLNRSILVPHTFAEQFNGTGTESLVLPNWPLLSLTSLGISGVAVTIAPQTDSPTPPNNPYGWRFQPWDGVPPGDPAVVELVGGAWYIYGGQNVVATYRAGYQVSDEVPDTTPYLPLTPYGIWATDEGVVYASTGAALTPVARGPTPPVGSYVPPEPDADTPFLNYIFNGTDVISGLQLSYGFVPADLEQAAIEMVMLRGSYRSRVGYKSQSLASQETITYDLSGIPDAISSMISPYRSVLPPATGANV